jgi:uncharacterized membrane protein YedE/YeeE
MGRNFMAGLAGLVFGIGLVISEMINPAKVLGFLDVSGNWDPSLAFVMGGGLVTTFLGYRFVLSRSKPVFDASFQLPTNTAIDLKLAMGAILFGLGGGLVGLCPGPALAAITIGGSPLLIFVGAMLLGFAGHALLQRGIR